MCRNTRLACRLAAWVNCGPPCNIANRVNVATARSHGPIHHHTTFSEHNISGSKVEGFNIGLSPCCNQQVAG